MEFNITANAKKIVCVINHCNEWHEYASFKLIGVVKEDDLDAALRKIKKECGYSDDDMDTYIDVERVEVGELDI